MIVQNDGLAWSDGALRLVEAHGDFVRPGQGGGGILRRMVVTNFRRAANGIAFAARRALSRLI